MGKRYTAKQALEAKIVHFTCSGDKLMSKAIELSKKLIKEDYDPGSLQRLKMDLYHKEYRSLGEDNLMGSKL